MQWIIPVNELIVTISNLLLPSTESKEQTLIRILLKERFMEYFTG